MAFTSEEKHKIIRLLGWPGNTLNADSIMYNNIVTMRLLVTTPETEAEAMKLVDRVTSLDTKLEAAIDSTGVKRIDDIEFFGSAEGGTKIQELRKERKRLIREISDLLGIAILSSGGSMGNVCV